MAKNTFLIWIILFACVFPCCAQLHVALKDNVTALYSSQIGIRERTGNNDGKDVEKYLASVGLKKGNAWCAAFVYWTLNTCSVAGVPRSGYSPSWFPKAKTIYQRDKVEIYSPGTADVFGIWFQNKNRIAHVGFIDEWREGSYTITVEGNTNESGSREGDGVYRKRRLKSQIYKVSRWL